MVDLGDDDSSESEPIHKSLKQLPRFLQKNQINLDNAFELSLPNEIKLAQSSNFKNSSMYL